MLAVARELDIANVSLPARMAEAHAFRAVIPTAIDLLTRRNASLVLK